MKTLSAPCRSETIGFFQGGCRTSCFVMKKIGIMNKDISSIIAGMGHNDELMICGSAFPIPDGPLRVDLALEPGLPAFMDVVRVVVKELEVERIVIANETMENSPHRFKEIINFFADKKAEIIPQKDLKERAGKVKACIRTGECTPFSNVILVAGVIF